MLSQAAWRIVYDIWVCGLRPISCILTLGWCPFSEEKAQVEVFSVILKLQTSRRFVSSSTSYALSFALILKYGGGFCEIWLISKTSLGINFQVVKMVGGLSGCDNSNFPHFLAEIIPYWKHRSSSLHTRSHSGSYLSPSLIPCLHRVQPLSSITHHTDRAWIGDVLQTAPIGMINIRKLFLAAKAAQ